MKFWYDMPTDVMHYVIDGGEEKQVDGSTLNKKIDLWLLQRGINKGEIMTKEAHLKIISEVIKEHEKENTSPN